MKENKYKLLEDKLEISQLVEQLSFFDKGKMECLGLNGGMEVATIDITAELDSLKRLNIDKAESMDIWSRAFRNNFRGFFFKKIKMSDVFMVNEDSYLIGFQDSFGEWIQLIFKSKESLFKSCTVTYAAHHRMSK